MSQVDLAALTRQVGDTTIVKIDANQSIANATKTIISWESESIDDLGAWVSTSASRLTVPVGVTRVALNVNLEWQSDSTGIRDVWFLKNGAGFPGQSYERKAAAGNTQTNVASPVLPVVAGDYFEARVYQDSGGSLTILTGDVTHFAMSALG